MPVGDFGTLITDAFGKFHDISKGAFDSYSMKHEGNYEPGFSALVEKGFPGAEARGRPTPGGVCGT